MKNKKIILGVVGLLVVVFLILPKVFGGQIEDQIRDIPNQKIYQDMAQVYGMKIEVSDYQSGWFSSEATFHLTLPEAYQTFFEKTLEDGEVPPLVYKIPVKHGPVIFGNNGISFGAALMGGEIHFLGENLEGFSDVIKTLPTANYSTLFEFSGKQVSSTAMEKGSWSWEDEKGGSVLVSWEDIVGLSVLDLSAQTLNSDFSIPVFTMEIVGPKDEAVFFEMKNLTGVLDYDLSQTAPLFTYEGFFELESGKMRINEPVKGETIFSFSDFREDIILIRHEDPDIIGYKVPMKMGPLVLTQGGETTTPLKSLDMVFELDNIDQKSILEFYEGYFDTFSQIDTDGSSLDSEDALLMAEEFSQELEAINQNLIEGYLKFMELGVRFDIPEAFIELEQGTIEYSHKLQFPPLAEGDKENLQAWAMGAVFSGETLLSPDMVDFFIDKTLETQMGANFNNLDEATRQNLRAATLGQLLLGKYLVKNEDDTYTAVFSIEGGILNLNGNLTDLAEALGQTS